MQRFLLIGLGIIFGVSAANAQSKSDCVYTLKFGTLSYRLCDGLDTVPKYNEKGEIVGDTAVKALLTNLYRVAALGDLQNATGVNVVKNLNGQSQTLRVRDLKVVIKVAGKTQSNAVQAVLNPAVTGQLKALKKGDTVTLSGMTFYDDQPVTVPVNITVTAD